MRPSKECSWIQSGWFELEVSARSRRRDLDGDGSLGGEGSFQHEAVEGTEVGRGVSAAKAHSEGSVEWSVQ